MSKSPLFYVINSISGIIIVCGIIVVFKHWILQNKARRNHFDHSKNPEYIEQTNLESNYITQANIVMLGNSFFYKASWNELLERTDVINRGIGGDVTEGYINRLKYVFNVKPKICFIEGGLNDIQTGVPPGKMIKNLELLIDTIQNNHIKPVLFTITCVAEFFRNAKELNIVIDSANKKLIALSKEHNIDIIDINKDVSENGFLKPEYCQVDGDHFTAKTYIIWKRKILEILKKENL